MGELTRFTLVRDVERREPRLGSGVPLLPARVTTPPLLASLEEAQNGEAANDLCVDFLGTGAFVAPDSLRGHPLGRFSAWLRSRGDRATVAEIRNDSPVASVLGGGGGACRPECRLTRCGSTCASSWPRASWWLC